MFTSIRGFWGAVGVAFALVAIYLIVANSKGTVAVINASATGGSGILKTLQGRS